MFRLTPVVRNLILINVIVFVLQWMIPNLTNYIALWGLGTGNFKPYQLFTYMFAHDPQGLGHIFGNMLFLMFTGPMLEDYWGQKKFLLFYMIAGLGAGIFYMLMNLFLGTDAYSVMFGASGAVYGVMTAFGIIFANMEMRLLFLPISFKAKYLILVLGSLAIFNSFSPGAGGDGVAHLAHLGGIVVAIIIILYWRSQGRY
jgi:membrane associated rhomboid family serine protease